MDTVLPPLNTHPGRVTDYVGRQLVGYFHTGLLTVILDGRTE